MKIASPFKLHVLLFSEILSIIIIEEEMGIGCVFLCVKMAEKERCKFRAFGFVHMPIEDSDFWGFYCIQMGDRLCVWAFQKYSKRKA